MALQQDTPIEQRYTEIPPPEALEKIRARVLAERSAIRLRVKAGHYYCN
jgi:hypothetical protein